MVGLGLVGVHVIALGAYITHAFVEHALKIYVMIIGWKWVEGFVGLVAGEI